jgi:hypothetical protein
MRDNLYVLVLNFRVTTLSDNNNRAWKKSIRPMKKQTLKRGRAMLHQRKDRSGNKSVVGYMKWVLTAISGALTTAFIVMLGPVSA